MEAIASFMLFLIKIMYRFYKVRNTGIQPSVESAIIFRRSAPVYLFGVSGWGSSHISADRETHISRILIAFDDYLNRISIKKAHINSITYSLLFQQR